MPVHWNRFTAQTLPDRMARFPSGWDLHVFALRQVFHSCHELCLHEGPQSKEWSCHSKVAPWFWTKYFKHTRSSNRNPWKQEQYYQSRPLATGLRWVSSVCETAPNRSGTHQWEEGWEALAVEPRPRNAKLLQTWPPVSWMKPGRMSTDTQTSSNRSSAIELVTLFHGVRA